MCEDSNSNFEVDHIVPRISGGTDEFENMQLICLNCHQTKTTYEAQSRIEDECPMMSRFSLSTFEAFVKSAKPPQCVANMTKAARTAISVDVRRCRYNAFVKQDAWPLPIYSPVDQVEPATNQIADYQWIEIHIGRRSPRQVFPYFGPGWYGAPTAAFLLDAGIATWGDFKLSFNASAHRPGQFVADRLTTLERFWREAANLNGEDEDLVAKHASVALIGLWGARERNLYRMITSSSPFDATVSGAVTATPTPGTPEVDGNPIFRDYVFKQTVLELSSMRPVHQRCLEEERLHLARIVLMVEKYQKHKVKDYLFSYRVDEVFCWVADKKFKEEVEGMTYDRTHEILPAGKKPVHQKASSSKSLVYKFKRLGEPVYPGGTLEIQEAKQPQVTYSGDWQVISEGVDGPDDFAERIVQHIVEGNSCCIEGPAGTGKTEVLKKIEEALQQEDIRCKKICLTHCGSRNLGSGGVTAHSFVHRNVLYGTFKGVVLIDEISFMSLDLLAALEHLRLNGARLICFGDFMQFTPVSDSWRGAPIKEGTFQNSELYKAWAECTKFVLQRCRRSDSAHFDFCNLVRGLPAAEGVRLALERYTPRDQTALWNLVISHRKRKHINDRLQRHAAKAVDVTLWIPDAEVPFHIFTGTRLMGKNNDHSKIRTGAFLDVLNVTCQEIEVVDEHVRIPFKMSPAQVAKYTRLRHAMTLYSTQGRSLPGTIAIHDWKNRYFTSTSLYVALSRAKESDKVWLATN